MLRIDGLSKRYPNGTLALDGIALEVAPGGSSAWSAAPAAAGARCSA